MCSSNAGRCPADRPTSDVPERVVVVEEEEELVRSVAAAILLSTTKGARTARPAADDASATCTCVRACVRASTAGRPPTVQQPLPRSGRTRGTRKRIKKEKKNGKNGETGGKKTE